MAIHIQAQISYKQSMFDDISGRRFNRLVAIERIGKKWLCICDCGNEKLFNPSNLKRGLTKSCGCFNKELCRTKAKRTHGKSLTTEYKIWQGMHQRCGNPNDKNYPDYGARGISVCERWSEFEFFYEDMGQRPVGLSIDRKTMTATTNHLIADGQPLPNRTAINVPAEAGIAGSNRDVPNPVGGLVARPL
jgi:hypothetical protein